MTLVSERTPRETRAKYLAPSFTGDSVSRFTWGSSTRLVKTHFKEAEKRIEVGLVMYQHRQIKIPDTGSGIRAQGRGFTVIEILIVVVLIGIAALIAVPMMSSAASIQIRAAANMIAADLEYAKSMAISRGQNFSVVFDENTESYQIENQAGTVIPHPVKKGFDYAIDFGNDSRLDRVDIVDADFDPDSSQTITFDYLGSPYSGAGTSSPLNSGTITLQAGGITKRVRVVPVTGYISITD
ncbi:MAG: GspH/FimT family pseudopilin [Phycisphaerae bacterium]